MVGVSLVSGMRDGCLIYCLGDDFGCIVVWWILEEVGILFIEIYVFFQFFY